jgi:hypothetical protein
LRDGLERGHEIRENGKAFSVGRLEEEARERVSLLVVELRAARNWLGTWFDRGLCFSLRIVNVLGYEIGLETSFQGSSSYQPGLSRGVWLAAAPTRSTNSPVRTTRMRTRMYGRSHWTPGTDTGHWTPDIGQQTADTGRADAGHLPDAGPDGRTLDTRTLTEDADRATKTQWASGHPGTTTPLGRRTVLLRRHTRRSATMTARR